MSMRIGLRAIYQVLSLVLVALIVAVNWHQLHVLRHLSFGLRLTLSQALPSVVFAMLPFALLQSKRPGRWPGFIEVLAASFS